MLATPTTRDPQTMAGSPIPLQRIRRLSLLLAHTCLAFTVVLPFLVVGYWLIADAAQLAAHAKLAGLQIDHALALWQRQAGAAITLIPLGLLLTGLWHVRRCFLLFADGRYFELQAIHSLRRFAACTCASVVASLFSTPALSVLLTISNAPGQRQLAIGVSSEQLFTLFIAGMVWLIAAVMTHACALAEENAGFV